MKIVNYNPEIVYLTISSKINTRFFDIPQMASRSSTYNFLNSPIENPNPGTVVME